MVQGYGRTHGSDARERRQCGSGGATAAHRGESSRRDDGEAARRPFHAGPVPNQRCHCQDTTRAQQGRLLADGRRREPRLQGAHSGRCPVRAQGRVESDGGDGAHTGVGEGIGEVSAPPGRLQGILDTAGRPVEHAREPVPRNATETHILWCVDNDALNGAFGKNPFHAKNNAINFLAVYVDGRQVPAKPLQPNFETGQYVRSYVNLFSATGKQGQDEGNELTRDDFGNGYTFYGFDLTPDACDGSCFHLVQKGNLRIEIHFAAPLAQTVNVVVYGESEAVLEIDKGRNIIYDH